MGGAKHRGAAIGARPRVLSFELVRRLRDPAPPVAGLLLDVDGVLYDDTVWLRWLLKLVTQLGLHTHFTPFFHVWQRDYLARVKSGQCDYSCALRLFLRAAGLNPGQVDEVEAAGHARRRACECEIFPLPGVLQVLACLESIDVRLIVCSTGYRDEAGVREQLTRLGVSEYFERILTDVDAARTQPPGCALGAARSLLSCEPHEFCYVGRDSAALLAAHAAGFRTVAVNHDGDAEAGVYLQHFEQLLGALPWKSVRAKAG